MIKLRELNGVKRLDGADDLQFFPADYKFHPGRMHISLATNVLKEVVPKGLRNSVTVADPMSGVGSIGIAALKLGLKGFVGVEIIDAWSSIGEEAILKGQGKLNGAFIQELIRGDGSDPANVRDFDVLFTSPPFPNAHDQGSSKMQDFLKQQKSTYAGGDFIVEDEWGCGRTPDKDKWKAALASVLLPWLQQGKGSGKKVLVHIKNYVRKKTEVYVDQWVEEVLQKTGLVSIDGFYSIPLLYRSFYTEMHRFPLVPIMSRTVLPCGDIEEYLKCGHSRTVSKNKQETKSGRCRECGEVPGHREVREERVVVATIL